jgi:hypothetical protein
MLHTAHDGGPDAEATWHELTLVYRELPRVRAELLILESAAVRDRLRFMHTSDPERDEVIDRVIRAGGLANDAGKFVELG